MKHDESYVKDQLIAYIGNKRNLMSLLEKAVKKIGVLKYNNDPKFLDLFAGSGVVSRLAKSLGFFVTANDWEYYSYIINKAFIEIDKSHLNRYFRTIGGIDNVLDILNNLTEPKEKDKYISKYYCPENDDRPDIKNERMFYTNYNGKRIDAIRAQIKEWVDKKIINEKEEMLLLALLLYEASTRSNTSGVFKGFHKGFGGTNGDALSRILKPVQLKKPNLIDGRKSLVFKNDAVLLSEELKDEKYDVAYLDPPYNQHQYGSNYHLLNTIALNDKPAVNKKIYINGKKTNKSAIRRDWIMTKSSFCYKRSAKNDFKRMVKNINAKYILVSYSTDGIISFDDMLSILSTKGQMDVCLSEYVKYRGGKQALTTQVKNIEFILIVNTSKKGGKNDAKRIKKILLANKIDLFMKKTINPIRAEAKGFAFIRRRKKDSSVEKTYQKKYGRKTVIFQLSDNKVIEHNLITSNFFDISIDVLIDIYEDLEYITNLTKEDEVYLTIEEIVKYYRINMHKKAVELFRDIPYFISKFNNKKAYIPSLKTIVAVLDMMIQTMEMWKEHDITEKNAFKKFEKIILMKLNYDPDSFNNDVDITTQIMEDKEIENKRIHDYKKQISALYNFLIETIEKCPKVSKEAIESKSNTGKKAKIRNI